MKLFSTLFLLFACATLAQAADFTVNTTADTVDVAPGDGVCADSGGGCSLRAAISETNSLAGADTIALPAGTYSQTLVAANEDVNAGGDFDIRGDLKINGAGRGVSFVQAAAAPGVAAERVFHNAFFSATVTLSNMTVRYGVATESSLISGGGGGIRNNGMMTLDGVEVSGNQGTEIGGGIFNWGMAITLNNSFVTGNLCTNSFGYCSGGGLASLGGDLTINNTVFFSNTATSTGSAGAGSYSFGGGLVATGSKAIITRSVFSNNGGSGTSGSQGSGLRFNSIGAAGPMTVEISDTTVTNSTASATGTFKNAAGIAFNPEAPYGTNPGTPIFVTLTNVTVDNNTGAIDGGGITAGFPPRFGIVGLTLNLNNCTISGNTASGVGGGMLIMGPASVVNISNSTIAGNAAGTGGGITVSEGTVNIRSSIIADNTGGAPDILGAIVSGNYNLFESIAGATVSGTTTKNITGVNPQLAALAENGGLTRTRALMPTSPAIDKGSSFGIMTDQRGSPRPIDKTSVPNAAGGDGADIGAFEAQNATASGVTVSGKVMISGGKGLSRTTVTMTDRRGQIRTASTNRAGNFVFDDVRADETYVFEVRSKFYQFNSQVVIVTENLENLKFTATN